ncbi:regulator [Pantoea sp. UYEF8]|uniref:transcriptional antitermination N peptide n=1 Tax=Pantoea sp. UYEF8 TaxID=1756394 RepID=UPI003397AB9A
MTVITYGTSVKENAKSRRHARRRAVAMDRDRIESIIDTAFGIEPEVVAIQVKHISRIEKACISPSLRDRHEGGAVCLPEVALYNAGNRKSNSVTAR